MAIRGKISAEHTRIILLEMFRRVGLGEKEFEAFDFSASAWYETHNWTLEEQEDFRKWLGKFLVTHKYVGKTPYRGQNWGEYEASKFILNYGWKVNNWDDL